MNGLIPHSHDRACSVFIYFPSSLSGSLQRQQLPDQTLGYSKDAGQDNNSSSPPFSQIPHFIILKEISSPEEECVCVCVCSDWEQQEKEEEAVALESWGCQIPLGARLHQAGGSTRV